MTAPALRFETYRTGSGSEMMLALGPRDGPQVLFLEAFLEERNFLRRTMILIARHLADAGIGSCLPDLPGTGDSLLSIAEIDLADWRRAAADAAHAIATETGRRPVVASIRTAALIDDAADAASWWRFAPAIGADLLRTMRHAERIGGPPFAGYRITATMAAELERTLPAHPPGPLREAESPAQGAPLWRRAEPTEDRALAAALAKDLAAWVASCATA